MDDKEKEEFFRSLSEKEKAEFNQRRKNLHQLAEHIDSVSSMISDYVDSLYEIVTIDDPKEALKRLVLASEKMELVSKDSFLHDDAVEYAHEFDWVRHVLAEKGTKGMKLALRFIRKACQGDFEAAKERLDALGVRTKEAESIMYYWREQLI